MVAQNFTAQGSAIDGMDSYYSDECISFYNAANEDYIPISVTLIFALVTNNTNCVTIPILNDPIVESDEVFFLQSTDTNLTETIPQTVMITIVNDDGKLYY